MVRNSHFDQVLLVGGANWYTMWGFIEEIISLSWLVGLHDEK